jgi:hypothetical protein
MWLSGGSENSPETHEYSETLDKGIYYIKITEYERGTGGYYISYTDSQISSISLNKTFLKLSEGQKIQLNATIKPKDAVNKTLEWSSSNEDIVGVWKDGWIKAKQAGKSTIYVKATDGSKKEAICTVVVIPNKVSKVYLNSDKTTSSTIGIDWNSSYNADGYRVMLYDKNKKKFVKYRDTSKTSMTIKGLTAETKYRVKVIPYIKDGSKKVFGEESSVYKVYTAPKKLKAPVIKSKTKVGEYSTYTTVYTTVKLKWSKVSGATGYYIYRSYDGGKYEKLNGLITKTSCYVYVINGKTARYKVVAYRTKNDLTTNGKASKTVKYRAK